MKKILYFINSLFLVACSDIVPEFTQIDNTPTQSDKIYLLQGQNYGSVKISHDGTIWACGEQCFYALKDETVTKFPNISGYNQNSFTLFKSSMIYINPYYSDRANNFVSIDNNTVEYYEIPNINPNHEYTIEPVELENVICFAEGTWGDDNYKKLYIFDGQQWRDHTMAYIPSGYVETKTRYNYILKTDGFFNLTIYDALNDKEKTFDFNFESPYGSSALTFSNYCIDKSGNVYATTGTGLLAKFDINTGTITTKTITIPNHNYYYLTEIYVDDNNEIWYFGFDNESSIIYFAYNSTSNQYILFDKSDISNSFDTPYLYITKNGTLWIHQRIDNYTSKVWAFSNGNQIFTREMQGTQFGFEKEDNLGNYWFGVWSQEYPYALDMFSYKDGEYKTYKKYFMYPSGDGYIYPPGI